MLYGPGPAPLGRQRGAAGHPVGGGVAISAAAWQQGRSTALTQQHAPPAPQQQQQQPHGAPGRSRRARSSAPGESLMRPSSHEHEAQPGPGRSRAASGGRPPAMSKSPQPFLQQYRQRATSSSGSNSGSNSDHEQQQVGAPMAGGGSATEVGTVDDLLAKPAGGRPERAGPGCATHGCCYCRGCRAQSHAPLCVAAFRPPCITGCPASARATQNSVRPLPPPRPCPADSGARRGRRRAGLRSAPRPGRP